MELVTTIQNWIGDSKEVKPQTDVAVGSTFTEDDTRDTYRFDGDQWVKVILGIERITKFEFRDMFEELTNQLKLTNLHLSSISGENLTTMDI